MTRHSFVVVLKEPGRGEYLFHTVARSETEALKIARRHHVGWRHLETRRDQ